ncbi:MAG: hypothetical protein JSW52_06790 [Candidatus Coatesbacteria bacterium]|nr:MAG: hypothetical protein JSW52_06790 [Candidatus Coatesbacteria bacterium]
MKVLTPIIVACLALGAVVLVGCDGEEDCVSFDPGKIEVKEVEGSWKIVEGDHLIMDFGSNKEEAYAAYDIIKYYGITSHCFVGRPDPSMVYYLVNGKAPTGPYEAEDCIPFDPDKIEVKEIEGSWKIVEGDNWILDFGDKKDEADLAYSIIKKYGFTHICFVGRPDPSMTYFRAGGPGSEAAMPDLVPDPLGEADVVWDSEEKVVKKVTVNNIGTADAGEFMVYINPEEDPVSPMDRPQLTEHLDGLSAGETVELGPFDFGPLATANNAYLANVKSISVLVDPKSMVDESNENNNSTEYALSP